MILVVLCAALYTHMCIQCTPSLPLGEVDDAELLAAALQEDEEEEDTSVTAI